MSNEQKLREALEKVVIEATKRAEHSKDWNSLAALRDIAAEALASTEPEQKLKLVYDKEMRTIVVTTPKGDRFVPEAMLGAQEQGEQR